MIATIPDWRDFEITITVGTVRRIRDRTGVDLQELAGGELFGRMLIDSVLVADVAWSIVCDQIPDMTREQFDGRLRGDAIAILRDTIFEEMGNFFPSRLERDNYSERLVRIRAVIERHGNLIAERLAAGLLEKMTAELLDGPGGSSGAVLGSSASTLMTSRSAS